MKDKAFRAVVDELLLVIENMDERGLAPAELRNAYDAVMAAKDEIYK